MIKKTFTWKKTIDWSSSSLLLPHNSDATPDKKPVPGVMEHFPIAVYSMFPSHFYVTGVIFRCLILDDMTYIKRK